MMITEDSGNTYILPWLAQDAPPGASTHPLILVVKVGSVELRTNHDKITFTDLVAVRILTEALLHAVKIAENELT